MLDSTWPDKWKKMELLVQHGLRSREELNRSILRFKRNEINRFVSICKEQLSFGLSIIIIAVTQNYEHALPNYIINTTDELYSFLNNENDTLDKKYIELWCCPQTSNDKRYFGRISSMTKLREEPLLLEVIWAPSARAIDLYSGKGDFISETISLNGVDSRIKLLSNEEIPSNLFLDSIEAIKEELYNRIPQIMKFAGELELLGIKSLCIEFTYEDGCMTVIDFDTENDIKVLNYYTERNACP